MTPQDAARMVLLSHDDGPTFVSQLTQTAALFDRPELHQPEFEQELADALRAEPDLVRLWNMWSSDQRWTPSAGVSGRQAFWVRAGGRTCHRVDHDDEASAVADFLHRLCVWVARREELDVGY